MTTRNPRLYLHIGTHKTGSSSLQYLLGSLRKELLDHNFAFFEGQYEVDNHVELFAVPMRHTREAFAKSKYDVIGTKAELIALVERFGEFRAANPGCDLIATTEGLSLLRYDDEFERLKEIIHVHDLEIIVVLVLRNREAFLKSFENQILKHKDRKLSDDPESINYVKPDSWLGDFDTIKALWAKHFGTKSLRVIDYDEAVKNDGDVLPQVIRAMDMREELIPKKGTVQINSDNWKFRLKRILNRLGIII